MTRFPSLEEQDQRARPDRELPPDSITHWGRVDRWRELGRQVATLRDEAKRAGVPLETMPGARGLIEAFKAAGRGLR